MSEDEDIASYFLWVDEVINAIRGLCEELKELFVVQKALKYLPKAYSPKVSSIRETMDLNNFSMGQLFATQTTFEMGEFDKEVPKKEATFKAGKKEKNEASNNSNGFDE